MIFPAKFHAEDMLVSLILGYQKYMKRDFAENAWVKFINKMNCSKHW